LRQTTSFYEGSEESAKGRLTIGPDGSLNVSSDQLAGRIFRVLYTGR